ncbi:MerR family transcriptional regulator [Rhodocyclus tenuis]|uniref:Methanogenic corrinoid protein MtbC1 n=1 Tax=Rhodocyclus tenuis TaxID=1066 RepID=A0A840G376_RHOTE|nr:MerR family transcriptional regulator [Rhodocyclus tenuis]MBB4248824.1 methanogenic corrinoid protein MtbC1 [Rhodocyclus tenuis]MBK1680780.1 MerR family transcriptional regulator [Rhodocyclus tenuis]
MSISRPPMNIGAVERDTGLGKDTLRVWERRYGFPTPARDAHGERLYSAEQVERLRLIKRLIDQGHRPGRLIGAGSEELTLLSAQSATTTAMPTPPGDIAVTTDDTPASAPSTASAAVSPLIDRVLAQVRGHDLPLLRQTLNQAMLRQGLHRFVVETVGPLNVAIGEAWMRGEIEVFEEHLYTEQITTLLRQAMASLPPAASAPRIVLTTVPDELHTLGLLMAQALLALDGASCIPLGTQTPLFDIAMAAKAHQAHIVALSFSASFPTRQVAPLVAQLRDMLPAQTELWIGGGGSERARAVSGVRVLSSLDAALVALDDWRRNAVLESATLAA